MVAAAQIAMKKALRKTGDPESVAIRQAFINLLELGSNSVGARLTAGPLLT